MSKSQTPKKGRPTMSRKASIELRRAAIKRADEEGQNFLAKLYEKAVPKHVPSKKHVLSKPNKMELHQETGANMVIPENEYVTTENLELRQTAKTSVELLGDIQYQPEHEGSADRTEDIERTNADIDALNFVAESEIFTIEQYNEKSRRYKKVAELAKGENLFNFASAKNIVPGKYRVKSAEGTVVDSIDTRPKK